MGSDWTGTGRRISRMAEKEGDGMDRRHTVLVVDSGAENCLLLSDMLRGDYNIVEVQDGREAMACLEHRGGEIALMLLDVDAPETGGLAALAAMEKSGYTDSVPVIVLSGDDVSSAVDQAWELGAVECVTRPYRAAVVRRRVRNVLMLYAKQRLLEDMVAEQLLDRERSSQIAVEVLSDIAAFRGNKSDHVLALLEQERIKYLFFASMSREIQFEYDIPAKRLTMSDWGADFLGISDVISNPRSNEILAGIFAPEDYQDLRERVYRATPQAPVVTHHYCLTIRGERRWYRAVARLLWMQAGAETPTGIIGKFVDVHEQQLELDRFKQMARHDALTGLYNRDYARLLITRSLGQGEGRRFAMLVLDLDFFKSANDCYGHMFGDQVLRKMAEKLRGSIRETDVAARIGGDEFLLFLEYGTAVEPLVERICAATSGQYQNFAIRVSVGVALSPRDGTEYESLFHRADQALYAAKQRGRGCCCHYDNSMRNLLSVLSPVESASE